MKATPLGIDSIFQSVDVVRWEDIEFSCQKNISEAILPGDSIEGIVYPNTEEELAEVVACAHRNRWGILPYGRGSKLGWGGLVEGVNIAISTERLNRLIEHAVGDLTITVEAGTKFSSIQEILAKTGQFLAIDPTYPQEATIGGIVATGDSGSLRQRYNSVRDMLLGISFVRADGKVAKAGGRVVKNVAGYDLMKLLTGSFGTLGIISQVTFRVYPQAEASATVVLTGKQEDLAQASKTILTSALTPIAVDLVSTKLATHLDIGESMGLIIRFESVAPSVEEQSDRVLEAGQKLGLKGRLYIESEQADLWQKLQYHQWAIANKPVITCKIGALPATAITILQQLDSIAPQQAMGLIHAGKGLGVLRFDVLPDEEARLIETIEKVRSLCQSYGGFLSILEAPVFFKQQMNVWGYTGNAIDLMRNIKKQFDPNNILSPHRFVGGI